VRAAELRAEPYCAREPGSGTRTITDQRLAGAGIALRPSLEMTSTESLKRAVLGGGFALLSRHTVVDELAAGALVALAVRDVDLHRVLRAVRRPVEHRAPRAAEALWRWLDGGEAVTPRPARR
jgi:DNA-binding transcriptional LysR family regulator